MKYHYVKRLDLNISALAAGTWGVGAAGWGEVDDNESIEAIRYMMDNGVNLVDTAPVYGLGHSETVVGKALKGIRDKVFLVSKAGITRKKATGFGSDGPVRDSSKPMIINQVNESLERLKTDYLDVLLIHWPDVNTPFAETVDALDTLKRDGKIRFGGICNFSEEQIEEFYDLGGVDFAQYQFSLVQKANHSVLKKYHDLEVATMAYGPLGGGILSGRFRSLPNFASDDMRTGFYPFFKEPVFSKCQELLLVMDEIAKAHGVTTSQVAINYACFDSSVTTALVGVTKLRHAKENLQAMDFDLSEEERRVLDSESEKVIELLR